MYGWFQFCNLCNTPKTYVLAIGLLLLSSNMIKQEKMIGHFMSTYKYLPIFYNRGKCLN